MTGMVRNFFYAERKEFRKTRTLYRQRRCLQSQAMRYWLFRIQWRSGSAMYPFPVVAPECFR